MNIYKPIMKEYPKALPLARMLTETAAAQGASMGEFEYACKIALDICSRTIKRKESGVLLSEIKSEVQATFQSI